MVADIFTKQLPIPQWRLISSWLQGVIKLPVKELLEDTIEYYCDTNMVSGETAWTMVAALADAKLKVEFTNEQ